MSETYAPGYQQFPDQAAAEVAAAKQTNDRRQQQARQFQESRTPQADVRAGEERL